MSPAPPTAEVVNKEDAPSTQQERRDEPLVDAVFGQLNEDGPAYRGLGWIRTAVLMTKAQLGLGILGVPAILATLGLVPGTILIFVMGLMTAWSGWVIAKWKIAHPETYSMADIGYIIAGPIGREVMGAFFWITLTFVAGAGILGVATCFNALTKNASCTAVWGLVGAVLVFLVSSIRTLDRISWLGWVGLVGIMASVITLAIAVGVQDRPSAAPQVGPWDPQVILFGKPTFLEAMSSIATILFAFSGIPNFLSILAEMRRPEDFTKSLALSQTFVMSAYLVIGCVVYHYCGIYVASPALGSAGPVLLRVCYGIALPGLVVGATLSSHLTTKYMFLRFLGKSRHVNSNSLASWSIWLCFVFVNVAISYVVAEVIPIFGDLVSLIGALFATVMCLSGMGFMYLWENRDRLRRDRSFAFLCGVLMSVFMLAAGTLLQVAGTVAAIKSIVSSVNSGAASKPFAC
ncbi:hypothetical protein JCM10207_009106 [Rhodosporidiobolus poonsookiae]